MNWASSMKAQSFSDFMPGRFAASFPALAIVDVSSLYAPGPGNGFSFPACKMLYVNVTLGLVENFPCPFRLFRQSGTTS
eukprot:CAMPEP_0202968318 /NCGR_PEP_ID=MMETSP1396-20130829/13575_1 /ASSEMBLY_ACC=CAM_ASM_000872 /TAXON_ID= /ORGANISM="Pseudokeronopsis sp., Strain Brazil" /LENGTH=78 /DNA_ID=CAMNT_0049694493 /DNA_START=202 /DNA_END=438 /DNA_ORIENTATION=-